MNAEQVVDQFRATGALLEGHFQLSSGLHSTVYLQCALVLQFPEHAESFGRALAEKFQGQGIQLVASPAIGGIVIGHEVARALGARFVWTERESGEMTLRRGFTIAPGEKTLIVEDVITTGGSTRETIDAVRKAGADVVGAASIIDRSGGSVDVGVPLSSLASLRVLSVESSVCDACKLGEPVVKPGSRTQKAYPQITQTDL
ncbi:MAG TPA: orotate phosphoribosyltransferase [Pyrinomonadaceae bacterium]|nr:orotate phosphoribosyltransferase [Pyrinomonadaceae bacterium]